MKQLTNLQKQKLVSKYIKDILANNDVSNDMLNDQRLDTSSKNYIINFVVNNYRLKNNKLPDEIYTTKIKISAALYVEEYINYRNWFIHIFNIYIEENAIEADKILELMKEQISVEDYNDFKLKINCKLFNI